jgi:hypothetical protein
VDLFIPSTLFYFWLGTQDIVAEVFAVKLGISPTKLEFGKAKKTCDIISPSPQVLSGDICYI